MEIHRTVTVPLNSLIDKLLDVVQLLCDIRGRSDSFFHSGAANALVELLWGTLLDSFSLKLWEVHDGIFLFFVRNC